MRRNPNQKKQFLPKARRLLEIPPAPPEAVKKSPKSPLPFPPPSETVSQFVMPALHQHGIGRASRKMKLFNPAQSGTGFRLSPE